jgi:hypothetical protein
VRRAIPLLVLILVPAAARAQANTAAQAVQVQGHFIGESIARFLQLNLEARQDVDVCRQHPASSLCKKLLGAIESGDRAEISTSVAPGLDDDSDTASESITFMFDGKKLVKLTMLVSGVEDANKILGKPSKESDVPSTGPSGQKWSDHVTVWDSAAVYATLYQDNNPSLQDRRPILVIESPEEHTRENPDSQKMSDPASQK